MDKYWENGSGYYDSTVKEVIENESKRNKEIHDTINEIKNILKDRDLVLAERIIIKDNKTGKTWR